MADSGLAAHHVRKALREFLENACAPGDWVVLAVSGGADSLALAAAAASIQGETSLSFLVVIVDHSLQPESASIARVAAAKCEELGLSNVRVVSVEVDDSQGDGIEAAARAARYAALRAAASEVSAVGIVIAHTREDQAETVLLRLARGSGTRAIAGMQKVAGDVWRPLLHLSRQTLRDSLSFYGLTPHDDVHNRDPRFLRSRIRHEVMPLLRDVLGPEIESALAQTAELAGDDANALDHAAAELYEACAVGSELTCSGLRSQPAAISKRVVRSWLIDCGVPAAGLTRLHIEAVHRLATDSTVLGPVKVAGGVEVAKASGRLRVLT